MRSFPATANMNTEPGVTRASRVTAALISYIPISWFAGYSVGVSSCTWTSQPPSATATAIHVSRISFDMPPPLLIRDQYSLSIVSSAV